MKNVLLFVTVLIFLTNASTLVLAENNVEPIVIDSEKSEKVVDNDSSTKPLSEQIQSAFANTKTSIDTSEASTKINDEFERSLIQLENLGKSIEEHFTGK